MKPLIVANWKMNPQTLVEAKKLFNSVKRGVRKIKNVEVVICPPFIYFSSFKFQVSGFKIGSQNCFWEEKGAFTGEISPLMLKDLRVDYVIIGHSERRIHFGETDEIINRKIKAVIKAEIIPILCVGETQKQKAQGETDRILRKQIETGLESVSSSKFSRFYRGSLTKSGHVSRICIAYEPIWAIGTGKSCSINETMSSVLFIRKIISHLYNRKLAENLRILYGGSVTKENASDYVKEARTDGLLIGGASLKAKELIKIVEEVTS